MLKSVLFLIVGSLISFLFTYFFVTTDNTLVSGYYSLAFGLGWALAYYVDQPKWTLPIKMGISFIGIALLIAIGLLMFTFEIAIPSVIRFSTVFVAYYLIASFRQSKSLRY